MADKGSGSGFSRKKVATRSFYSKQQALKVKNNGPSAMNEPIEIDSSDSDDDLVVAETGSPSEGSKKGSTGSPTSRKASVDSPRMGKTSLESPRISSSETPATKGDWSRGGKPANPDKGSGKGSLPKATAAKSPLSEVELKLEIDIPKNATVLMNCETAAILHGIQDTLDMLSDDPDIEMPESFIKALQYCDANNNYNNAESARQVLDTLRTYKVTEGEICMIGNTCPESVDELYALIPSLKANRLQNEGPITDVLSKLATFKQI